MAHAALLLLLVVLPAAFNPAGVLAFEPVKTSLLRVLTIVIAAAWLAHRFWQPAHVDIGTNPVVRAGLAVIALGALSTALSIEPALSFFGSFDRGMGWLSLACGGILLLVGADLLSDARPREQAISALLIGAIFPCAYALVQRFGLDPVNWTTLGTPGSSLGSPTFLGGYLVLVMPFAAYKVAGRVREPGLAYAGWLALLLVIFAVAMLTTIRGSILGLFAAIISFAAFARPQARPGRREILGAVGLLVVGIALAVAASGSGGVAGLQRFVNIARGSDSSIERLTVWRDALRVPLGDPFRLIVGFGLETQASLLERGEAIVRLTQNQQWDRAHNLFLDTWLTGGLFGLASLLVLVGCGLYAAWRARRLATRSLLPVAILAALIGHLVEMSFAFDTIVTGTVFWLVLGLAASLSPPQALRRRDRSSQSADTPADESHHGEKFSPTADTSADESHYREGLSPTVEPKAPGVHRATPRSGLAVIGILAGLVLLPLMAAPAVADALYGAARHADYVTGAQLEETAAQWAPWVEELPRAAALDWLQVANRRTELADRANARAEVDLVEAAARAPLEPLPHLRLARLYLRRNNLDAAEQSCQRALATGPYRVDVWDACATVSTRRGLPEEAHARHARAEQLRQSGP